MRLCALRASHTAPPLGSDRRASGHFTGGGGRDGGKMSAVMLLSVSLALCLLWATGGTARTGEMILMRDALERGPVSLNDMFREVEELMEDTQHILEEAVDQVCVIFYSFIHGGCCWLQNFNVIIHQIYSAQV